MSEFRYSPWVRSLRWLVFMLVAAALMLIYIHTWTPRGTALHAGAKWAHMQFGIAILLVMLPRLLVPSRSRPTATEPSLPRWQAFPAQVMHLTLYVLLLATPLLGIANRAWNPGAWGFLGIPLPHVAHPDRQFAHMLEGIHENFGNLLMYLAALHAAAALIHHFVQRDDVLRRMLPSARTGD